MDRIKEEDFRRILRAYKKDFEGLGHKKILITGASGMITTYLAEFLLFVAEQYHLDLYLQCRNQKKAEALYEEYLGKKYLHIMTFDFENGDIPDICFDYIIHAASPASTSMFVKKPVDVISPNVIGTWHLLQHARRFSITKFLFFSSNSIYGEGGTEKEVLTERDYGIVDPLNERSSYIESKRLAEQMCLAFWKQYQIPATIIRICHTYGPTFDIENDSRIIPRIIRQILEEKDIEIYKDPHSVIQYTYIADMVTGILLVLLKGECGQAYNAGANEVVKMDDVVSWMVYADERIKVKLIEKEIDKDYPFAPGKGVNFVKVSNEKLRRLGWVKMFDNRESISRIVVYYIEKDKTLKNMGRSE